MLKTRITELFNIDYPVIQGGMQWVSKAELVAAISNAGCLGILSALTFDSAQQLADEIKKTKSLTDRPFGVNITLLPSLRAKNIDEYIDVTIENGIKIIETAGRNPEPYMKHIKDAGLVIIHKCTAVRFARKAEQVGCDVVSIDGFECAGHPGEEDITSLILVPRTVDTVQIPVIASGGFGDGRGLIAALALGAEGINMGTRFMLTRESPIHPAVMDRLLATTEVDTSLVMRSLKNSMRVINNETALKVLEMEKQNASLEQLAPFISGLRQKNALDTGLPEDGLLTVGQVIGLINNAPTVEQVVNDIVSDANRTAAQLGSGSLFVPLRKR